MAAAVQDGLAAQLEAARAAQAAAAEGAAEALRAELRATAAALREDLEGVSAALPPLQQGVAQLQDAVASVAAAQRDEASAALAPRGGESPDATAGVHSAAEVAASTSLSSADLTRLAEGVSAVAGLLRDVDAKLDGLGGAVAALPAQLAAAARAEGSGAAAPRADVDGEGQGGGAMAAGLREVADVAAAACAQQAALADGVAEVRSVLVGLTEQLARLTAERPQPSAPPAAAERPSTGPVAAAAGASAAAPPSSAEVLSFEAALVQEPEAPDGNGTAASGQGDGGAGPRPGSAEASESSREEAYERMLRLAEARRRNGGDGAASAAQGGAVGGGGPMVAEWATEAAGSGPSGSESWQALPGQAAGAGLGPSAAYGAAELGPGPVYASAATPPQQQQPQQQQQWPPQPGPAAPFRPAGSEASSPGASASAASASAASASAASASAAAAAAAAAAEQRPLEGLSATEVIREGLRLLRLGRDETRKAEVRIPARRQDSCKCCVPLLCYKSRHKSQASQACAAHSRSSPGRLANLRLSSQPCAPSALSPSPKDFGLADSLIQAATSAFAAAAEQDPGDAKALGNLGNALLARGELKAGRG